MISASKLKNAENAIKRYRPFIEKTRDIVVHLASNDSSITHPLMENREIKMFDSVRNIKPNKIYKMY